ncbi:hypothetical protein A4X06_0g1099 [Tilletia controversa]|uniref:Uncharacterized protein n=1 Tax=Tilletia controversa TaxID=13291 RepID=A0A8X7MZ22_9BASI|nr:hypothetical protein A4X06_0g1099 [Tilletia controversa]
MKRRDQRVHCWCYSHCARFSNEARTITVRSRDRHITEDKSEVARATALGYPPPKALLLALQRNKDEIAGEEGDRGEEGAGQAEEERETEKREDDGEQKEMDGDELNGIDYGPYDQQDMDFGPSSDNGSDNSLLPAIRCSADLGPLARDQDEDMDSPLDVEPGGGQDNHGFHLRGEPGPSRERQPDKRTCPEAKTKERNLCCKY